MTTLRQIIEAILFVSTDPVPLNVLAQITEESQERVHSELDGLSLDLNESGRGLVLREVAEGWRLYSHPEAAPYVERFVMNVHQPRLTQAALEVLSIVAYKQPITRQQVAAIRGVDSDGVVGTLEQRGLVEEVGRDPGPGQAALYGTTTRFLEALGLNRVSDLPSIAELLPPASVANEFEA
ncbi:MAG: SMC-Scp complex subunit ScpB [Actinomycetota bacterium]